MLRSNHPLRQKHAVTTYHYLEYFIYALACFLSNPDTKCRELHLTVKQPPTTVRRLGDDGMYEGLWYGLAKDVDAELGRAKESKGSFLVFDLQGKLKDWASRIRDGSSCGCWFSAPIDHQDMCDPHFVETWAKSVIDGEPMWEVSVHGESKLTWRHDKK